MNFYHDQVIKLTKEVYPKDYLVKQVVQAKRFIDKNYTRAIELKDMAGDAFFSKFHFIRVFTTMYGQTPYQYLKAARIEKAKKLLRQGRSVIAVCYAVGFNSPSSFTGLFKRATGSTPSAFIKKRNNSNIPPLYNSKKFGKKSSR